MEAESAATTASAAQVLLFIKTQVGFAANDRGIGDIHGFFCVGTHDAQVANAIACVRH